MDRHPSADGPLIVTPTTRIPLTLFATLPIAAILAAMFFVRPSSAAPPTPAEDFWTFPDTSFAFLAFDPKALGDGVDKDPTRALVEAGLRGLLANLGTVEGGGTPLPDALLRPGLLGTSPYRLCLLDIAGSCPESPAASDRPLRIERLAAILEVRAPPNRYDEIIGAVRGALDRDAAARRAAPGNESPLALPGGRAGTAFTHAGDPEWREVSWSTSPSGVLIGLGHGALERWLAAPAMRNGAFPEWYFHRNQVVKRRGATTNVLEVMIDASALRRSAPEWFAYGRFGRVLDAWHIPNAREAMVHVRLPRVAPPKPGESTPPPTAALLLLIDLSYSSRADKPPTCAAIPVSEGAWPAGVTPTKAPYAVVLNSDWTKWASLALDTWIACSPHGGLEASAARARWMRTHGPAMERAIERAGPFVVINGPAGSIPTLLAPLKPGQPAEKTVAELREMFAPFAGTVHLDAPSKMWTLRLTPEEADPDGLLARFCWQVAKDGSSISAAWNPEALAPPKPPKP